MVTTNDETTGGINAHAKARRVMAQEKAGALRRRRPAHQRVARIEAEAREWQRKQEEERVQRQIAEEASSRRAGTSSVELLRIRPEEYASKQGNGDREHGIVEWLEQKIAAWGKKSQWTERPKVRLNSASICAFSRRIMAREWARIRGRRPFDYRAFALEREARLVKERELRAEPKRRSG